MNKLEFLENEYLNYTLADTLKKFTFEELNDCLSLIMCCEPNAIKKGIYDLTLTEIATRKFIIAFGEDVDPNFVNNFVKYYKNELSLIRLEDIKTSIQFYKANNIDYKQILFWFPALLSANMCLTVFNFMSLNNMDNDNIRNLLVTNLNNVNFLYEKMNNKYSVDENNNVEFINFVNESIDIFNKEKNKTESFQKMFKGLSIEYDEVLKRLK